MGQRERVTRQSRAGIGPDRAAGAREASPEITGIYVAREDARLTVSGVLRHVFSRSVEERLAAGLPLIVQIRFELCRDVRQRPDTKLAATTILRTATWDRLRQEYTFTEDGPAGPVRRATRSKAELKTLVTALTRVPIVPLPPLLHRRRYGLDALRSDCRRGWPAALQPFVSSGIGTTAARQRIGRLAGME